MNKFSIVTICFNNLDELIATCNSVDSQSLQPYEHIVVDGSTNQEVKKYLETHPQPIYRKWICEPDKGIADAFSKGAKMATGDFIQILNSADIYYDQESLKTVFNAIRQHPTISWLHAMIQLKRGGLWVQVGKPFEASKLYRGMRSIWHPTMFVKKEVFEKYGYFNLNFKIAMDYEFLIRIRKEPFYFLPKTIVIFDPGGISSLQYEDSLKDGQKAYEMHFGPSFKLRLWQLRLKFLRTVLNSKLGKGLYKMKTKLKLENA